MNEKRISTRVGPTGDQLDFIAEAQLSSRLTETICEFRSHVSRGRGRARSGASTKEVIKGRGKRGRKRKIAAQEAEEPEPEVARMIDAPVQVVENQIAEEEQEVIALFFSSNEFLRGRLAIGPRNLFLYSRVRLHVLGAMERKLQ